MSRGESASEAGRDPEAVEVQNSIRVVGTAGHVDHGKSSLIEALTGRHPDRLQEERARQMTIDLGFGWLSLPNDTEVGIIDVPGHTDFIENMVAGVVGMDAVLLVVAADEGVRPQTREHLAIVDLLGVRGGIIVLSKADLLTDNSRWSALEAELRSATSGTVLEGAPMVRVSAHDRTGLADLLEQLSRQLDRQARRQDLDRPRLAVDRVFSMEGFGTVVTGTLLDGQLMPGDEVEFQPGGLRARVRGLQHHGRKVQSALPGARTAVNLAGLDASEIERGNVLTRPGQYVPTRRLDARVRVLPGASAELSHHQEVKILLGTTESMARLRLLGNDRLGPGQIGLVQLELARPVVCAGGDKFLLRRPSPAETLGGGVILDAAPKRRHKRFDATVLESLDTQGTGSTTDIIYEMVVRAGPSRVAAITAQSRFSGEDMRDGVRTLLLQGRLIALHSDQTAIEDETLLLTDTAWEVLVTRIRTLTQEYHQRFPLRPGIPREEMKNRLKLESRAFSGAIKRQIADGLLVDRANALALPDHVVQLTPAQQSAIERLLGDFRADPGSPPSLKQCKEAIGEELFNFLKATGQLVPVSDEVVFLREGYDDAVAAIRTVLSSGHQITLAQVRDLLHTSRKYAQALLEHLDALGVTRRDGDTRTLVR